MSGGIFHCGHQGCDFFHNSGTDSSGAHHNYLYGGACDGGDMHSHQSAPAWSLPQTKSADWWIECTHRRQPAGTKSGESFHEWGKRAGEIWGR